MGDFYNDVCKRFEDRPGEYCYPRDWYPSNGIDEALHELLGVNLGLIHIDAMPAQAEQIKKMEESFDRLEALRVGRTALYR